MGLNNSAGPTHENRRFNSNPGSVDCSGCPLVNNIAVGAFRANCTTNQAPETYGAAVVTLLRGAEMIETADAVQVPGQLEINLVTACGIVTEQLAHGEIIFEDEI